MRILLVEDDIRMADFLRKAFKSQMVATTIAHDGEAAIRYAKEANYDVIILDIILPKVDGIEVCKTLREEGVVTPIIFLSSKSEIQDKVAGLDSGADDYLAKPFSFTELFARVRAVMRRKETLRKPNVVIDDLSIDLNNRTVTREGKEIYLSPREFRILEHLVHNQGKVVSRVDILENIWGSGSQAFSNTVEVHISHLRSKLNKGFDKKLIKTIREHGYLFE